MTEDERTSRLLSLSSADREALAADRALTAGLRRTLPADAFARTAALLMVDVPPGTDLPVSTWLSRRGRRWRACCGRPPWPNACSTRARG